MTPNDAFEFFVELVGQLFHADVLIADQAQQIEALEPELASWRTGPGTNRSWPERQAGRLLPNPSTEPRT